MGLRFSGKRFATPEFEVVLEAFDGDKRVLVITSAEALEDYEEPVVMEKASDKYSRGIVDEAGRVRVFTTDFS